MHSTFASANRVNTVYEDSVLEPRQRSTAVQEAARHKNASQHSNRAVSIHHEDLCPSLPRHAQHAARLRKRRYIPPSVHPHTSNAHSKTSQQTPAAQSGTRTATIFDGGSCTGSSIDSFVNFGCGGTCHSYPNRNIVSVLLNQQFTGNPKPTADFYASSDCSGSRVLHAGILNSQNAGCSNMPSTAHSFYLYHNC